MFWPAARTILSSAAARLLSTKIDPFSAVIAIEESGAAPVLGTFVVISRCDIMSPSLASTSTCPFGTAIGPSAAGFSMVTSLFARIARFATALGSNVNVAPLSTVTLPKAFPVFGSVPRYAGTE